MARTKAKTLVQSLLTAPTVLAVGLDPAKGEAYIMAKNADTPTLRKKIPLTPEFQALFMAARSLLA